MNPTQLSDTVYVSAQINPSDIPMLKAQGFGTIICNRPDGEDFGQPTAAQLQEAAEAAEMSFFFVPYNPSAPSPTMVEDFGRALDDAAEGKVLAYCRSGNRSAKLWQASGER